MSVAVIGAGMAGAAAASTLKLAGWQVEVFDKGRSAGGRMSSKRDGGHYLDLGAQYFTARSEPFNEQVSQWLSGGVISYWPAKCYRFERGQLYPSSDSTIRLVGKPSMQAPVKALLADIAGHLECRISRLHYVSDSVADNVADNGVDNNAPSGDGWYLFDQHNQRFGPYQALILALPPVQLHTLLATAAAPEAPGYNELIPIINLVQAHSQALLPCWAVNLQLAGALPTDADAIFVKEGNISWLARQNSKPARDNKAENWLVHFSPQCSILHLQAEPAQIAALAKAELELIFDLPLSVNKAISHRWLYAQINPAVTQDAADYHAGLKLAFAGDWLKGGRVENAWLSGVAAAKEIIAHG
ncbi:NAD(P)/FAD-dependent oxidoreductase [Arsukibacterium sp. UBA3155]|uniref:NAD(P)/FAD-dependent oxidoreductase n=1 Tax=Arsukibacterium sp. UBA3155 TaxID=1946058 RepID=UPI0025C40256|nr:NAD(P)-binding protein [Arsukibacterium sp. UBA3155]|tara:strand:+ start:23672 stop:24745 length:1074 start_codon:yes stop_codon:yes gene_type:complete